MKATSLQLRSCRAIVSFVAMAAACSSQDAPSGTGAGGTTSDTLGQPQGGAGETSVGSGGTSSGSGGTVGSGGHRGTGGASSRGGNVSGTGGTGSAASTGGAIASTGSIQLRGNKILDTNGNAIVARGPEDVMASASQTKEIDQIAALGANAMRMLFTHDAANGMTPAGFDT